MEIDTVKQDANPKVLLKRIVNLIDRDLGKMEALDIQLSPDDTIALARYSKSLIEIISQNDADEEKDRDYLSKLDEKDLKKLALKSIVDEANKP